MKYILLTLALLLSTNSFSASYQESIAKAKKARLIAGNQKLKKETVVLKSNRSKNGCVTNIANEQKQTKRSTSRGHKKTVIVGNVTVICRR